MKALILGIDALGQKSLEALQLTKLQKKIEKSKRGTPAIDNVVSRGWAEFYSGKTAYETGAFYQIPVLSNGRILQSQSTGSVKVSEHVGEGELLWNKLQSAGWRVGLYTLPTVTTPQERTEFSVSATGGGNFNNKVSRKEVHPPDFAYLANYSDVNLGFRHGFGAFLPNDVNHLEQWIRDHLAQHFFTLELALEKYPVDCLIFGTRFVTIAYKFIRLLLSEPVGEDEARLKEMLLRVSSDFDDRLARLIREINPEHLFIVSDHGNGPLEYHVNINELLLQIGEITAQPWLPIRLKRLASRAMRTRFQSSEWHRFPPRYPAYNLETSTSFSIGYTDLIYINDQRFTGPEMSTAERYEKSCLLAERLKVYTAENGMKQFVRFEPLKNDGFTQVSVNPSAKVPLPDIRCVLAEGCSNLGRTNRSIVEKNEPTFGAEMFKRGIFAEYSGCKTTDVIAAYSGPEVENIDLSSLPSIYHSIISVMGRR
ncbi:hypothetical protein [Thalassospira lucentensis]|uniref:hypothetical protein n=1 Tax=Thalassospira lucentensis TaxID=168935 RepID=UPI00399D7290